MNKRILIQRATEGSSGRIDYIGEAMLPVYKTTLGAFIDTPKGNGCASSFINCNSKDVEYVVIGEVRYIVQTLVTLVQSHPLAEGEVTIHHDNLAVFSKVVPNNYIELI